MTSGLQNLQTFNGSILTVLTWNKYRLRQNCTWDICQFIHFFCERFNATLKVITDDESPDPPTIDLNNKVLTNPEYNYADFREYLHMNVILPLIFKENRYLKFLMPFKFELWLLIFVLFSILSLWKLWRFSKLSLPKDFEKKSKIIFIISGGVAMALYSINLQTLFIHPLNTYNFTIICGQRSMLQLLQNISFKINIKAVEDNTYWDNIFTLNTSFGYCIDSNVWRIIQYFQKPFKKSVFYSLFNWKYTIVPYTFLLKRNSIFEEKIKYLIHEARELGFFKKWNNDESRFRNVLYNLPKDFTIRVFTIEDFLFPLQCLIFGNLFSIFCFLFEIIKFFKIKLNVITLKQIRSRLIARCS